MQKLRQIYLALGISDCSMEEGSMRCDGNVSLRRRGAKEMCIRDRYVREKACNRRGVP